MLDRLLQYETISDSSDGSDSDPSDTDSVKTLEDKPSPKKYVISIILYAIFHMGIYSAQNDVYKIYKISSAKLLRYNHIFSSNC